MKKIILFLFLGAGLLGNSQQMTLKKGVVIDSIGVKDSISESFSLYIPTSFEMDKNWPILYVYRGSGKARVHTGGIEQCKRYFDHISEYSDNRKDVQ